MIKLSFKDYLNTITMSSNFSIFNCTSLKSFDTAKIDYLKKTSKPISKALRNVNCRATYSYYNSIIPCVSNLYHKSCSFFPVYKYLLPTIINVDWLAIMDWKKFSRDHIIHQPLTAYTIGKLIGLPNDHNNNERIIDLDAIIMNLLQFSKIPEIKDYLLNHGLTDVSMWFSKKNDITKYLWKQFFIQTAYIAALFHDLGYPWQYANRENCEIVKFTNPVLFNNMTDKTKEVFYNYPYLAFILNGYTYENKCVTRPDGVCFKLKCMLNCCPFTNQKTYENSMERFCGRINEMYLTTHGLPGALNFLHLYDGYKRSDYREHPIRRLSLEWAAAAIAMHDMKDIYWGKSNKDAENKYAPQVPNLRIHADKDPISAIVTLADILQEFERPTSRFRKDQKNDEHLQVDFKEACNLTEVDYIKESKTLRIKFYMTSNSAYFHKKQYIEEQSEKFFDPDVGFLDLKPWGIHNVKMEAILD